MSKLILTVGQSNSGKSTWASEYVSRNPNTVQICRDDYRFSPETGVTCWGEWNPYLSEDQVSLRMTRDFIKHLYDGKDIVVSDTNLNLLARNNWLERAKTYGLQVEYVVFYSMFERLHTDHEFAMSQPDHVLGVQYRRFKDFLAEQPVSNVKYTFI